MSRTSSAKAPVADTSFDTSDKESAKPSSAEQTLITFDEGSVHDGSAQPFVDPFPRPAAAPLPERKPEDYVEIRNLNVNTDMHEYELPTECIRRPGFNTSGTAVPININSYPVLNIPDKIVHQYDVSAP